MPSVIIFEARVGPTLTKELLNPFEITFGSIVTWSFSMNCFEFLVILFLLMTSLTIVQTFRRLFFILYYLVLIKMLFFNFQKGN